MPAAVWISRLPEVKGDKEAKRKFKTYPIGYFHIDIAEVQTAEGKLRLFVAIDRTSKFAFVELHEQAGKMIAAQFLRNLIAAVPYAVHTVLTDNGIQFANMAHHKYTFHHLRPGLRRAWHRAPPDQDQTSLDQRPGRANEPDDQGGHGQALPLR
jgi:hypothetical protein